MNRRTFRRILTATLSLAASALLPAGADPLTVYCGRGENLIGPLIEQFRAASGLEVEVRYGGTAELAATLLEEGANSPADVYFAQDAGALGALTKAGRLAPLPDDVLSLVPERFRSRDGTWVGLSGRARTVVYNTERLTEADLPAGLDGFTDPVWKGRLGWAPENASFQAFITALRVVAGEEAARAWLTGMQANQPQVYPKNSAIVAAVAAGEIDAGFVNHYYLYSARRTKPDLPAANYYPADGGVGSLVNIAGAGVVAGTDRTEDALAFIRFMLGKTAQDFFVKETSEYPVIDGIALPSDLKPLDAVPSPDLDLNRLDDLDGTLQLLHDTGVL
jgi:iron(III) transport system substrate-binding protein